MRLALFVRQTDRTQNAEVATNNRFTKSEVSTNHYENTVGPTTMHCEACWYID